MQIPLLRPSPQDWVFESDYDLRIQRMHAGDPTGLVMPFAEFQGRRPSEVADFPAGTIVETAMARVLVQPAIVQRVQYTVAGSLRESHFFLAYNRIFSLVRQVPHRAWLVETARQYDPDLQAHTTITNQWAVLSPREQQVLRLLAMGLVTKEIASRLGISSRTVEGHRQHGLARLGLRSLTALLRQVIPA